MAWEIKPVGTDGSAQLGKYIRDGNLRAGFTMSPIEDIAVIGDYNMRIVFDNKGLASYSFYKYNDYGKRVWVTSSEVIKAYTKRAALAITAACAITGATIVEDVFTGGAGIADDAASVLTAAKVAQAILGY